VTLPFASGDRLVIFTDGVPDLLEAGSGGARRGIQILKDLVDEAGKLKTPNDFHARIIEEVKRNQGSGKLIDDITLITLALK
jgi:serine phosphatase RsbU (regulator of sigma subunit)